MLKKYLKRQITSFQGKIVKEDKSSSSATELSPRESEGKKEARLFDFAAARVYEVVRKIPKGKVLSYSEVAKLAGFSRAYRAVGNTLNKNQNPKIPCHRVIKSNGKIGGYKGGTKKKITLLEKEGIIIKNGEVTSGFNK